MFIAINAPTIFITINTPTIFHQTTVRKVSHHTVDKAIQLMLLLNSQSTEYLGKINCTTTGM